jgi:hypothetical protein
MKSKKAQGLSLETIIVIVLIFIALIVIVIFFTDAGSSIIGTFTDQANSTAQSANHTFQNALK